MFDYSLLNKNNPIKARVETKKIIVNGLDIPGILSHIIGQISIQGIEIEQAFSKSIIQNQIEYFEDEFIINSDTIKNEFWFSSIPEKIETHLKNVYKPTTKSPAFYTVEKIIEHLAERAFDDPPIVDIQINQKATDVLEIAVFGENKPFFLYLITHALEDNKLPVLQFIINTKKGYVEDVFEVSVKKHAPNIPTLRIKLIIYLQFSYLLHLSPDPIRATSRFQEIISIIDKSKDTDLLSLLLQEKSVSKKLAQVLGSSDLLWEDFVRIHSLELTKSFSNKQAAMLLLSDQDYKESLTSLLKTKETFEEKITALNQFKDEQIYLADINVIVNETVDKVSLLSKKLSSLAKIVLREVALLIESKLTASYGIPKTAIDKKVDWVLFGLGKFGGSALGYASDVEIMLIYEDSGITDGDNRISNHEYFELFVKEIIKSIKTRTDETFKIDVRMRPHGEAGPLAVRLSNFIEYYSSNQAHSVELLALTRLRPIVGSVALAGMVLRIKNNILFQQNLINKSDIFAMRKQQLEEKVKPKTRNAKFGLGALVDVEYGVQLLQIKLGINYTALHHPNMDKVLMALQTIGEISEEQSLMLFNANMFFRNLINGLRMRRGSANDLTLPEEHTWEIEHLARRIGYMSKELSAGEQLINDFDTTSAQVYQFLLNSFEETESLPEKKEITNPAMLVYLQSPNLAKRLLSSFQNPEQILQRIKSCAREGESQLLFSRLLLLAWTRLIQSGEIEWILATISRLVENLSTLELENFYSKLLEYPNSLYVLLDLFATSKFISEEIIKNPNYIFYIISMKTSKDQNTTEKYKKLFSIIEYRYNKNKLSSHISYLSVEIRKKIIRDFRKQEILRIIVRDISIQKPLKHICNEISCLAQTIVQKAFSYACCDIDETEEGIAILAFGKLGAHELNYSSDLDLLCVSDDRCKISYQKQIELIKLTTRYLSEYTADGIAYRVDWRLRPFGGGGEVVSSLKSVQEYYEKNARLWELQAAIKLRYIAGDTKTGDACEKMTSLARKDRLKNLVSSSILNEIHSLRKTSVKTHLTQKDTLFEVKNSWGGIRDIEFGVQAFQILNIEKTKEKGTLLSLEELLQEKIINEEDFSLATNNYKFLRKIEHFLQIHEDRQVHEIPHQNQAIIKRLSMMLLKEPDEELFLQKLAKVKKQSHEWYCKALQIEENDSSS